MVRVAQTKPKALSARTSLSIEYEDNPSSGGSRHLLPQGEK
jgi:hypothetical protein